MRKSTRLIKKDEVLEPHDFPHDLIETLYSRPFLPKLSYKRRMKRKRKAKRPRHYKIVCISLYRKDIDKLERHVKVLKSRGYTKANKSQIIRFALDKAPIHEMPRMY